MIIWIHNPRLEIMKQHRHNALQYPTHSNVCHSSPAAVTRIRYIFIDILASLWQVTQQNSATGTRTRVARVRAEYPNQLDYGGHG